MLIMFVLLHIQITWCANEEGCINLPAELLALGSFTHTSSSAEKPWQQRVNWHTTFYVSYQGRPSWLISRCDSLLSSDCTLQAKPRYASRRVHSQKLCRHVYLTRSQVNLISGMATSWKAKLTNQQKVNDHGISLHHNVRQPKNSTRKAYALSSLCAVTLSRPPTDRESIAAG